MNEVSSTSSLSPGGYLKRAAVSAPEPGTDSTGSPVLSTDRSTVSQATSEAVTDRQRSQDVSALAAAVRVQQSSSTKPLSRQWTMLVDLNVEFEGAKEYGSAETLEKLKQLASLTADRPCTILAQHAKTDGTLERYVIEQGKASKLGDDVPSKGFGENLKSLIVLSKDYPAERYALTIYSHGGSYQGTMGTDGNATLPDLSRAIRQGLDGAGVAELDLLKFDACLMGSFEVLDSLQSVADRVVASSEVEYASPGLDAQFFSSLIEHPEWTPAQLAADAIQDAKGSTFARRVWMSGRSFELPRAYNRETLSAFDMGNLPAFKEKLDGVGRVLLASMSNLQSREAIKQLVSETPGFSLDSPAGDLQERDLKSFVQNLQKAIAMKRLPDPSGEIAKACQELLDNLPRLVEGYHGAEHPSALDVERDSHYDRMGGISVFLPSREAFEGKDLTLNSLLRKLEREANALAQGGAWQQGQAPTHIHAFNLSAVGHGEGVRTFDQLLKGLAGAPEVAALSDMNLRFRYGYASFQELRYELTRQSSLPLEQMIEQQNKAGIIGRTKLYLKSTHAEPGPWGEFVKALIPEDVLKSFEEEASSVGADLSWRSQTFRGPAHSDDEALALAARELSADLVSRGYSQDRAEKLVASSLQVAKIELVKSDAEKLTFQKVGFISESVHAMNQARTPQEKAKFKGFGETLVMAVFQDYQQAKLTNPTAAQAIGELEKRFQESLRQQFGYGDKQIADMQQRASALPPDSPKAALEFFVRQQEEKQQLWGQFLAQSKEKFDSLSQLSVTYYQAQTAEEKGKLRADFHSSVVAVLKDLQAFVDAHPAFTPEVAQIRMMLGMGLKPMGFTDNEIQALITS